MDGCVDIEGCPAEAYVGDATACECGDATKNDDGSDGAATMLGFGYGAIAAAALLA